MRVVNLIGKPLTFTDGFHSTTIGRTARRAKVFSRTTVEYEIEIDGVVIPVLSLYEESIMSLPEPEVDTLYVVSGLVAAAAQRPDVVVPSQTVRDEISGRIESASALLVPWRMER